METTKGRRKKGGKMKRGEGSKEGGKEGKRSRKRRKRQRKEGKRRIIKMQGGGREGRDIWKEEMRETEKKE